MAAASHLLSVCIAASPVKGGIGLPAALPRSPPETLPRLVVRTLGSSPHRLPPRRRCCALASMLPAERHSCRSDRTTHGSAVSYSAWHTHIAALELSYLFLGGVVRFRHALALTSSQAWSKQGRFGNPFVRPGSVSLSLADRIERIERALTADELAEMLTVSRITIFKQAKARPYPVIPRRNVRPL